MLRLLLLGPQVRLDYSFILVTGDATTTTTNQRCIWEEHHANWALFTITIRLVVITTEQSSVLSWPHWWFRTTGFCPRYAVVGGLERTDRVRKHTTHLYLDGWRWRGKATQVRDRPRPTAMCMWILLEVWSLSGKEGLQDSNLRELFQVIVDVQFNVLFSWYWIEVTNYNFRKFWTIA